MTEENKSLQTPQNEPEHEAEPVDTAAAMQYFEASEAAADHAAGKLSESERMTRYAARNTRRPVPARWRARLELGYGAQSHQSPIWHQLHDQRTAAVLSAPSAAKT